MPIVDFDLFRRKRRKYQESSEKDFDVGSNGLDNNREQIVRVAIGRESNVVSNLSQALLDAALNQQDFICIPLFHPRLRNSYDSKGCISRSDLAVDSEEWSANVIGKSSEWIHISNVDYKIQQDSESALVREYSYACHLGLQTFVVNVPLLGQQKGKMHQMVIANLSRCLQSLCLKTNCSTPPQIWLKMPYLNIEAQTLPNQETSLPSWEDGWHIWNDIRSCTGNNARFFIALDLSLLPWDSSVWEDSRVSSTCLSKWSAEPVKAVIINTNSFKVCKHKSKSNHYVLTMPTALQSILIYLFKYNIHVMIAGCPSQNVIFRRYVQYVEKLCHRHYNSAEPSLYDQFCSSYRDNLQSPLHPLSDNLDSETYRIMEKDPVKYEQYERALTSAMRDLSRGISTGRDKYSSSCTHSGGGD